MKPYLNFPESPSLVTSRGLRHSHLLGIIGFASWAHHMFAVGMSFTEKTVFMVRTLAAVPASLCMSLIGLPPCGVGRISFAPMLFAVGAIMLFFASGAGGVVNTQMPRFYHT